MLTNKVLTDEEIWAEDCTVIDFNYEGHDPIVDNNSIMEFARAIEAAVLAKMQAQSEPVAWMGAYDNTDLYYRKPTQADVVPLYRHPPPVRQDEWATTPAAVLGATAGKRITGLEAEIAATEKQVEILTDMLAESRKQNKALLEALKEVWLWMENQYDGHSKGGHATFDMMMLREHRDIARAAIAAVEGKHD